MSKDNNNNDDYIEFKPELQGDDGSQNEHVDSRITGDVNDELPSSNEKGNQSSNNASDSSNSNDDISKDDLSSANNDNRSNDLSDNNQDNNNNLDKNNESDDESNKDSNDLENNEENDNMNDLNDDESNMNDNSDLNDSNELDNDDDLSNENNVDGDHNLDESNGDFETSNEDDINNLNDSTNDDASDVTGNSDNEQDGLSNDSGDDKSNDDHNSDDLSNNNDNNNGYDNGFSKNDATNDNSSELDPNDLNTSSNQSNDDINNMSKDLPSNQVNPDDDSKKESDAATDSNPDTDSKKENDAATDSNPDTDSKKENDAAKDTNPDEDSKKENDAAKDSNPDDDSKKDQDSSSDSNSVNSDPNNNLEKGIQKGATALGFGDEAKAAQTAKNLKDSLNDAKGDSKEKMQSAIKELGVSTAKGAVKAAAISYLWPVILAILALVFVSILVFGSFTLINNDSDDDGGCSADDKSAAMGSITTSKDADKNAENIYKYIISNSDGSTPKGVSALLGNIFHESAQTFDPSTIQGGSKFDKSAAMNPSVNGYAFGISQWDGGRRVKLLEYAEKKGKKWDDLELQLDYLLNGDGSDSDLIKKLIKSDGEVEQITDDIMRQWERAGATDSIGSRQAAAKKYYAKFSDIKAGSKSNISDSTDAGADNSDACGGGAEGKTDGTMGASVKPNGGTGDVLEVWEGKDKIPEKYRKLITLPDFSEKALDAMPNNIYLSTNNRGQCTELTWGYMSQLWSGTQPTAGSGGGGYADGNGQVIWKAYKENGAKITKNPTVGYGFSGGPPIQIGGTIPGVGHTGVVVGVLEDGKYIIANYNLRGEANRDHYTRSLTYALVDGQPKSGQQITFFSGIGKPKIKVDK